MTRDNTKKRKLDRLVEKADIEPDDDGDEVRNEITITRMRVDQDGELDGMHSQTEIWEDSEGWHSETSTPDDGPSG